MKAPFPYFGGKSKVAHLVWSRFGNVPNYVEPFFGSGAVLLARPHPPGTETVNDLDCYLANFWRATQAAPDEVARWCDWPVNECVPAGYLLALERLALELYRKQANAAPPIQQTVTPCAATACNSPAR